MAESGMGPEDVQPQPESPSQESPLDEFNKAEINESPSPSPKEPDLSLEEDSAASDPNAVSKDDDDVEEYNFELERKAKERLEQKFKEAKKKVEDWLLNCGLKENRPFETKKWNFDLALRAMVRDTLTYDKYAVEMV